MNRTPLPLWVALASTAMGCAFGVPSYRPVVPHRGAAPGIEAEIVEVTHQNGLTVDLKVEGSAGIRLQRGLLVPAAASPCREGVRDSGLFLDGPGSSPFGAVTQPQWLRPVPITGSHRITLKFPEGASSSLLYQTPVVDLVILAERPELREQGTAEEASEERCVRVALSGKAPELQWSRPAPWTGITSLRFTYPSHAVGSVDNGWSLEFGLGRWFGPVRAKLEAGFGIGDCRGYCPPGPKGSGAGFLWFPLRASIDGYLVETTGFGIAAEIGVHQFSATRTKPDETARWETSRGPRAALRFDFLALPAPGWPRDARQGAFGLELSLGRWSSATAADEPALVWGFGFVNHTGF